MKKKLVMLLSVFSMLTMVSCGASEAFKNGVKEGKQQAMQTINLDKLDWEKCIHETKEELLNPEFFGYVKDLYIEVNQNEKKITFTAELNDSTNLETAKEYADTLIRRFNLSAVSQNNEIKSASKEYYGGIYDYYDINIGIAPSSKIDNMSDWYVNERIKKGMFKKIN